MRSPKGDALDPKGLVAEAYKIEGITPAECRSIFLDWALNVQGDTAAAIAVLLERHSPADHPMSQVLREGLVVGERPRRRGGWRSRERP
ncbi:hypothetical protein [Planktotalea arctica]|uniref:hypothetical protein n=1 Tax=Planktotalea arctica TaxID=1481893 RepID=UPI003219DDF8